MKLSIIIPTIRGLSQIEKIFHKISIYENNNFEIVIINDNPKLPISSTLEIFKKRKVILINNKKNYGPGVSRNIGIQNCTGDYICFMDDDDEIDLNFIKKFDFRNKEIEIYLMRFHDSSGSFTNDELFQAFNNDNEITSNKVIKSWNLSQKLATHCQPYLFKKEYLIKKNIYFPPTYIVEDMVFNTLAMVNAKKIELINYKYYSYNSGIDTLKSSTGINRAVDVLTALNNLLKKISNLSIDCVKKEFINNTINFLINLFIIRILLVSEKNHDLKIQLNGLEIKNIDLMKNLGIKVPSILKGKIINSNDILNSKLMVIKKLRLLGINRDNKTYLYCCGQVSEYLELLIRNNAISKVYVIDDKVSKVYNHIQSIEDIKVNANEKNYFILCNQQNWINKKIHNKLIDKFHDQIEGVIYATELLE